jgi:DNA repair ATPase RecN
MSLWIVSILDSGGIMGKKLKNIGKNCKAIKDHIKCNNYSFDIEDILICYKNNNYRDTDITNCVMKLENDINDILINFEIWKAEEIEMLQYRIKKVEDSIKKYVLDYENIAKNRKVLLYDFKSLDIKYGDIQILKGQLPYLHQRLDLLMNKNEQFFNKEIYDRAMLKTYIEFEEIKEKFKVNEITYSCELKKQKLT